MKEEQNVGKTAARVPKTFGAVYYTVLAVVCAVLLIFSFVTYYFSGASVSTSVDAEAAHTDYAAVLAAGERNQYAGTTNDAVGTIRGFLSSVEGLTYVAAEKANDAADKTSDDQKITASVYNDSPTFTVQDFEMLDLTVDLDTVSDMTDEDDAGKEGFIYASRQVKNFVVIVPGTGEGTRDAVLFMTHYDSNSGSVGASSASSVAAMIAVIDEIVTGGREYTNDLVFVITDGRYEDSVGAYAFKNQFVGFDNVWSRVSVAFNFDAITAGGALTIVQTTDGDSDVMSGYLASSASVRTDSSVAALMEDGGLTSDFDIFYNKQSETWTVPALNFMTTAGAVDAGTKYDTLDNVTSSVTAQYASAMEGLADYFGNADISAMGAGLESASATYLGAGVGVPGAAVYVLAAVVLVLIAVNMFAALKKKAFGPEAALKGAGGVLLALALSLAAYFAVYFIIGLLAVAFGPVTMNMLVGAHLLTPAILVPAIVFAAAVQFGLFPAIKRGFKIKAGDCVRGGALLQMLTAAVFGFVFPAGSLAYLFIAVANGVVMLVNTLLKDTFRRKCGFGIERLFLYTIPAMFGLPFLIQVTLMIGNMFATVAMPFLLVSIALLLSSITPYFDYLQPVLSDAFYKLPKHTIPVVETVVEDREDAVKKGKFETVSETRVVSRKVSWNYHNWFGVTVLLVIAVVAMLIAAPVSAKINATESVNYLQSYDYRQTDIADSIYDDAVVCYIDASTSSTSRYSWLIKDEAVYQTLKYLDGYDYWEWTWDETFGAYRMNVNTSSMPSYNTEPGLFTRNTVEGTGYTIDVNPTYSSNSQVKMTLSGLAAGDTITVSKNGEDDFSLTFDSPASDVEVALPYGYGACTITVETSASSITVSGYEYCKSYDYNNMPYALNYAYEQFSDMHEFFYDLGKEIKVGVIIRG